MISIVQVALGGLAPPILAVHVALSGLAPVEVAAPPAHVHAGPPGKPIRIRIPRALRQDDEEILLIISAALQVLDIN